jgi:hypothetical protein
MYRQTMPSSGDTVEMYKLNKTPLIYFVISPSVSLIEIFKHTYIYIGRLCHHQELHLKYINKIQILCFIL